MWGRHAGAATGAFGGPPDGATKRARVCRNGCRGGMRAKPLGPSVEHEACEGRAEMSVGAACGRSHWGHQWSSLCPMAGPRSV
eukprot:6629322-Pyramimonas_sp.AAC.1